MSQSSAETRELQVVHRVRVEITWRSIIRLLLGMLLAYAAILLWPILKILVMAILLAVALYPIVAWTGRKGWPDWAGLSLAGMALVTVVIGCVAIISPTILREMTTLGETLPKLREQIIAHLPPLGVLHEALQKGMSSTAVADSRLMLGRMLVVVESTVGGLLHLVVVIVLAVYLMADGARALKWLIVFFPLEQREKIYQALTQIARIISSYVGGQLLISALAATYLFLVLRLLDVPMALVLGIIAGICDILPIIGFVVAVLLAVAMGLSVSPATALLIFVLYGAYHLFENFFILPRVYGKKLQISRLAVPLAVAAGGLVAGVVGAIVALPIVAAYPVVERLWLAAKLEPDTLKAHEERSP